MQRLSKQIVTALNDYEPPVLVAWSRSQVGLPLFMIWAALRILWGRMLGQISVLYLGDPVLAPLAAIVEGKRVPVVVTVHGLDIVYPNAFYQSYLRRWFWGHIDLYIAISRFVGDLLLEHGVRSSQIEVLPLGIDVSNQEVQSIGPTGPGPVLLAIGRLVPRKGFAWFVETVAPRVFARCPSARLVIAGDGPERARIEAAIRRAGLSERVELRGAVGEGTKNALLAECDAVIMPNVRILGDVEGFGLVALEAGLAKRPVFVADIDGLRDAVRDGENGWLLRSRDANAWVQVLGDAIADRNALRLAGERARKCVLDHYAWSSVGKRYAQTVTRLARA